MGPRRDPFRELNEVFMSMTMRTVSRGFAYREMSLVFFQGVVFIVAGCQDRQAASYGRSSQPVPVTISQVVRKAMPVQVSAVGNVEAYREVSVVAQVGGRVEKVHFTEGDTVRKGDILFSLDRRPFETALHQAQAQLDRNRLLAANATSDLKRYQTLVSKDYVSQEQFEKLQTQVAALEATLRADQSAVETATLNLQYATIRSPIDGRTGSLLVDQGNVVKANDKPMVVIRQVQPIFVRFAIPEKFLSRIRRHITEEKLRVQAVAPDMEAEPMSGELTFMENTVDTSTGTVGLKALFSNSQERLWPGQYVDVNVLLSLEPNVIVIPAVAVQKSSEGDYVLVLREDRTVTVRKIKVSRIENEQAVIAQGLKPGEQVVTDGQFQLTQGSKVVIKKARADEANVTDLDPAASQPPSSSTNASAHP